MKRINNYLFAPRFTFNRIQFNIVAVFFVSIGLMAGTYLTLGNVISNIFAASTWTQTDWSGGSGSSTTNQYSAISNTDATTTAGQVTLTKTSGWSDTYTSWAKRQAVTVTNSGSVQTDYQVKVSITYDADMQADFDDLRFTNSAGTALNYWIQSKTDSTSAIVWVKVDSLAGSGDTTLYMYYGNSSASAGTDGVNTFMLFDAFSSATLDSSKWTTGGSTGTLYTITGDTLSVGPGVSNWTQAIYSTQSFSRSDISVEMKYNWTSNNSSYDALMMGWKDDGSGVSYTNLPYAYYNSGTGTCSSNCDLNLYEDGSSRGTGSGTWTQNTQYLTRVRMRSAGGAYYEQSTDDGANWTTSYTSSYSTESNLHVGISLHSGTHIFDDIRVRKWMSSEPTSVFGSEASEYQLSGTLTSNIFDTGLGSDWGLLSYTATTPANTTLSVKVRAGNIADLSDATAFSSCSAVESGIDLTGDCTTDNKRYVQYLVTFGSSNYTSTPTLQDVSIIYSASDTDAPTTNASSLTMSTASSGGRSISSNGWNSAAGPYFSWTAGADNVGGSGLKGYCLYLGTDSAGNPATSKGLLGTSPVSTTGSTCQFIVSSTSVDLSTSGYIGTELTSGTTYYFNIKAIDNGNNVFSGSSDQFQFRQDVTSPTNVTSICTPGGSFSNVADMSFSWTTTTCSTAASDAASGLLGYQYQINSTAGTWLGSTTDATCGINYIPAATFSRTLTAEQDEASIVAGANTIYFRTVDIACNTSSDATIRTGSLNYGGDAPTFGGSDTVTISPSTSTSNSFAFSWPEANPASGQTITNYYYMINTSPPSSLSTITSNTATYIDNGTTVTVAASAVSGAVKGSNTINVIAVDDDDNYSPSNVISGTFTLNSTVPDPPTNLSASDASVKSASLWRASLAWGVPAYKGTGSLTYKIQRSTNGSTWTDVTTTSGTAYVDTVSESRQYYWRVCSYDTSSESTASPSCASGVTITPKGTYADAPTLSSGPTVSAITTKKAKITWSTSRNSDSKVQYGTSSGDYFAEEPSNSAQTTDHTIALTNLSPGTTYFYKTKWTDEDGNTGISTEKSFSTDAAPTVTDPKAKSIGLTSTVLEYTVTGAAKAKIYYGKTTSFGGLKEVSTSTSESTYTTELVGLDDGSKYYYKINVFDSEDVEYEGSTLAFETLPKPRISNVRIQQVTNTAQSTLLITWKTNTEVSSIVTYYPEDNPGKARDEVNVTLLKGEHKMILRGLLPEVVYTLIVKGRDKIGNEATSDGQKVTTATDTRPPQMTDLKVEGSTISVTSSAGQEQQAQLVVSWNTDELSSSQVEFGEGTGTSYAQKTQQDSNLTTNHLVIISGLTPSKVYHLRALSKDSAANIGTSIDVASITPKGTDNALNLVIQNLQQAFGFIGGLQK